MSFPTKKKLIIQIYNDHIAHIQALFMSEIDRRPRSI